MTPKAYEQYLKTKTPPSRFGKNLFWAFLYGGAICVVGQIIADILKARGISLEHSATLTSIVLIFIGALLTGLDVYDNMAKIAGAGTLVPITGFANAIVAPAMEFKTEGYVLGTAVKMFVIAGPVLVFGTVTSVIAGLIIWAVASLW